jgi:excisionase family DNA binding protein
MPSMESTDAKPTDEMGGYREVSAWLGIPVSTLYSMVHHKRIPHVRLSGRMVRFSKRAIDAWLAANAVSIKAKSSDP